MQAKQNLYLNQLEREAKQRQNELFSSGTRETQLWFVLLRLWEKELKRLIK